MSFRNTKKTHALILDGYVDEPGLLGVPPYISPEPRLIAGALEEAGLDWEYMTVDQYRNYGLPPSEVLIVHGGVTVPGKYLGGTPLSRAECTEIGKRNSERETYLGGPLARSMDDDIYHHVVKKDLSVYLHDSLTGKPQDRWMTGGERERWLLRGAEVVMKHPLYPDPLLAEVGTYRGCIRYYTGGCSFCSEPLYGKPEFREQKDVIREISKLYDMGIRNFRLGGQSCIVSYKSKGLGESEIPTPRPDEIRILFEGISRTCPEIRVLHVDNSNPAVMAEHADETEEILDILVDHTTPGNVLALGMETADPKVIEVNNLNASPEEVEKAVIMINRAGAQRGGNGMPRLLPGINFLAGLEGEGPETYNLNLSFLKKLLSSGLMLRRINIRRVLSHRTESRLRYPEEYKKFKSAVRECIDRPMLESMLPVGSVLKDVYMELRSGKQTFGRQIGTYPLLIGVEYPLELGSYHDITILSYGYRSVTGVHHPFYLDKASYSQLKALPGIGEKRAAKIFRARPTSEDQLRGLLDDQEVVGGILRYAGFSR